MCSIKKTAAKIMFLNFWIVLVSCKVNISEKSQNTREKRLHVQASVLNSVVLSDLRARRRAVKEYVASLTLEEQVCQLFLENLAGNETYRPAERAESSAGLKALVPGGYLFFSYNIAAEPEKIISFTDSIKSYCVSRNIIPPYLALDQEGGTVNRLRGITGPLPSCKKISSTLSTADAYKFYSLQAVQLHALGFTMNLAPVAEICDDSNREFLSGRSYGDASAVIAYGTAAVNAYQNNGVAAVLKHFPGNTNTDPHTGLPEMSLTQAQMESDIIVPFSRLVSHLPAGVLMSHVRTSVLDPDVPACLSRSWVTDKLRGEAGFRGIVLSDDIFMSALAGNGYPPEKAAVLAVEAGVDVIMISEKSFAGPAAVLTARAEHDSVFAEKIRSAAERIVEFKIQYGLLCLKKDNASWHVAVSPELYEKGSVQKKSERLGLFTAAKDENITLYRKLFAERNTPYAQK
ncbi:MAG: glycoside hydrolase family 3 protein [Treponema sp.]|nr:glycoside hydrolase family 3 protein [Treponema sp.]